MSLQKDVLHRIQLPNLGTDCSTWMSVLPDGTVLDYTSGGFGERPTTYEKLIVERQEFIAQLYQDIETIRSIQSAMEGKNTNG